MLVKDIMVSKVISVKPNTPLSMVAKLISQFRISGMPVLNTNKELVGVLSEKDVIRAMYPSYDELIQDSLASRDFEGLEDRYQDLWQVEAQHVMTKNVISVDHQTPVLKAGSIMIRKGIRRLPVIDKESNALVGVITLGDIHQALFSQQYLNLED